MTNQQAAQNSNKITCSTSNELVKANTFLDQTFHAWINQYLGVSYIAYQLSVLDWLMHLVVSPGTQIRLLDSFYKKSLSLLTTSYDGSDKRFKNDLWKDLPFSFYVECFLECEKFWSDAVNVKGVTKHHQLMNQFMMQQFLNFMAPTNFVWSNPEVLSVAEQQNGANFIKGYVNLLEDIATKIYKIPVKNNETEQFQVGKNIGITPGKVIFRNDLIELIQYSPTTGQVNNLPILIVPACIMKYYILDLSAHNSLVKYLVGSGNTVFMISWKNPNYADRKLIIDDYVNLGVLAALDVINDIIPNTPINAVGYCIGGTLLAITAAFMAGRSDNRLKSLTFFAAQVDFTNAGDILVFVDDSQISMLEDVMSQQGYLEGKQMGDAFAVVHSHDLIWGKMVKEYLIGERQPLFDIMAWNADSTRLPYKMHSEYLKEFFLKDSLIQGNFTVNGEGISLININVPIFAVGTVTDHVAPWKSVYKFGFFTKTVFTFLLTSGGHNVGIVSEPGHKGRSYQVMTKNKEDKLITADAWLKTAPHYEGSWWPEWQKWVAGFSDVKVNPPQIGNKAMGYPILCDAPGIYVLQK